MKLRIVCYTWACFIKWTRTRRSSEKTNPRPSEKRTLYQKSLYGLKTEFFDEFEDANFKYDNIF